MTRLTPWQIKTVRAPARFGPGRVRQGEVAADGKRQPVTVPEGRFGQRRFDSYPPHG